MMLVIFIKSIEDAITENLGYNDSINLIVKITKGYNTREEWDCLVEIQPLESDDNLIEIEESSVDYILENGGY